jgi:folate-dependent phosphoribosylglycinamide formyltransferase PurN
MDDVPRIVVLTDGSGFGLRLVRALRRRRVPLVGIAVQDRREALTEVASRAREYAKLARARLLLADPRLPVRLAGSRNSIRMEATLHSLAPDVILLGGMGVLSTGVLATARLAVLNAHPALLPWVRGTGVVRGSLLRGVPIGATVHVVDRGIDTGPVLARRLTTVDRVCGLAALEHAADTTAIELMADTAADIVRNRQLPTSTRLHFDAPLLRIRDMASNREAADRLLAAGKAVRLYREARATLGGDGIPPGDGWSPFHA